MTIRTRFLNEKDEATLQRAEEFRTMSARQSAARSPATTLPAAAAARVDSADTIYARRKAAVEEMKETPGQKNIGGPGPGNSFSALAERAYAARRTHADGLEQSA